MGTRIHLIDYPCGVGLFGEKQLNYSYGLGLLPRVKKSTYRTHFLPGEISYLHIGALLDFKLMQQEALSGKSEELLSEVSKKYFYKAYDNKLLKTYLESENFGATYAALLRIEGAKKLNPTLQRQQTIYSRNALNYANPNQCSAIIQNKPINKANGGLSGIELYARLPLKDYKNYFETYTKSAYLIFNDKDESIPININDLDFLNKLFISNLKEKLSEPKLNLFISVIQNGFANTSDEDVCEVGKLLLDTLLTTGNEQQSKLVINAWIKGRLLRK